MAHFVWLRAGGWHFYKQGSLSCFLNPAYMDKCGCEVITGRVSGGGLSNEVFLRILEDLYSSDFLLQLFVGDCITLTDVFETQEAHPHPGQAHLDLSRVIKVETGCSLLPWVLQSGTWGFSWGRDVECTFHYSSRSCHLSSRKGHKCLIYDLISGAWFTLAFTGSEKKMFALKSLVRVEIKVCEMAQESL